MHISYGHKFINKYMIMSYVKILQRLFINCIKLREGNLYIGFRALGVPQRKI